MCIRDVKDLGLFLRSFSVHFVLKLISKKSQISPIWGLTQFKQTLPSLCLVPGKRGEGCSVQLSGFAMTRDVSDLSMAHVNSAHPCRLIIVFTIPFLLLFPRHQIGQSFV